MSTTKEKALMPLYLVVLIIAVGLLWATSSHFRALVASKPHYTRKRWVHVASVLARSGVRALGFLAVVAIGVIALIAWLIEGTAASVVLGGFLGLVALGVLSVLMPVPSTLACEQ